MLEYNFKGYRSVWLIIQTQVEEFQDNSSEGWSKKNLIILNFAHYFFKQVKKVSLNKITEILHEGMHH